MPTESGPDQRVIELVAFVRRYGDDDVVVKSAEQKQADPDAHELPPAPHDPLAEGVVFSVGELLCGRHQNETHKHTPAEHDDGSSDVNPAGQHVQPGEIVHGSFRVRGRNAVSDRLVSQSGRHRNFGDS